MSDVPQMRALIIGIESYPTMGRKRPGTNNALREINERLKSGGWHTRLLTDEANSANLRSGLTQFLDGIEWLKSSEQSLLIFSGLISGARLYPCDVKAAFLTQSTLAISDVITSLPKHTGMIIDGPLANELVEDLPWVIVAQSNEQVEEQLFSSYGPTQFLHSITIALNTWPSTSELKVKDFFEFTRRQDAPKSAYYYYSSLDSMTLLSAFDEVGNATTLITGVNDDSLEESSNSSSFGDLSSQNTPRGGRFIAKGRFQLQRLLGEGGIGQVFLAKDTHLNKLRAVKLLKIPETLSEAQRAHIQGRMIQSARAAQELSEHSHHVVQVYDLGIDEESEMPFMVMEYLKGITLHERLYQAPALTLDQIFEIGLTLCETLAIAHQQGVIHRDLKPDNIMLINRKGSDLFLKLLDFDLVKVEEGEVKTQEGQILGTLEYMAPEQLKGMEVDARADVFALGAILYECFSGVRANPGKNQRELVRLLLDHGVKPLEEVANHLPQEICDLINRCLSLDADSRPSDAQELLVDLKPLQRYQPALSMMSFGLSFSEMSPKVDTPDTLAAIDNDSIEDLAETEPQSKDKGAAETLIEGSVDGAKLSSSHHPDKVHGQESDQLPAESTLTGPNLGGETQGQRGLIFGGALAILIAIAIGYFGSAPISSDPTKGDELSKSQEGDMTRGAVRASQKAPALKPIESLRLLPTPAPSWNEEVITQTEQVEGLGEAHVYSGGRFEERLSHLVYEFFFSWRVGDPPLDVWQESEALRYMLLSKVDLNFVKESVGKLYLPQNLYIDALRRRPSREKAPGLGEVLHLSDGLLLITPSKRCKNLSRGDLITEMRWVVGGKKRLNGRCEGGRCLNAHSASLKKKRSSKLLLTASLKRAERDRGAWVLSEEVVKCRL